MKADSGLPRPERAPATSSPDPDGDPGGRPVSSGQYNYRPEPGLLGGEQSTEMPGTSCFLRNGSEIFHTYSTYGRGNEYTPSLYTLLDLTALGRQEGWEEPKGRAPVVHDT
jgi:predicted dithiol-disulfide oxidoreductase (DUF899 family)